MDNSPPSNWCVIARPRIIKLAVINQFKWPTTILIDLTGMDEIEFINKSHFS